MKIILETERLLLREFTEEDYLFAWKMNTDPDVMRYTGEPMPENSQAVRSFFRNYPDYEKYGFGRWACVFKENKQLIGFNGLKFFPETEEVDLGYRFIKDYWGRGLATESSQAVVTYGFEKLGLKKIIAFVVPENKASIRVLQKTGFVFDENMLEGELELSRFYLLKSNSKPKL